MTYEATRMLYKLEWTTLHCITWTLQRFRWRVKERLMKRFLVKTLQYGQQHWWGVYHLQLCPKSISSGIETTSNLAAENDYQIPYACPLCTCIWYTDRKACCIRHDNYLNQIRQRSQTINKFWLTDLQNNCPVGAWLYVYHLLSSKHINNLLTLQNSSIIIKRLFHLTWLSKVKLTIQLQY